MPFWKPRILMNEKKNTVLQCNIPRVYSHVDPIFFFTCIFIIISPPHTFIVVYTQYTNIILSPSPVSCRSVQQLWYYVIEINQTNQNSFHFKCIRWKSRFRSLDQTIYYYNNLDLVVFVLRIRALFLEGQSINKYINIYYRYIIIKFNLIFINWII